ncbi:YdiK family protein [Halalkalibacterium halodurans]|jgi:phosphatidylglycerophosphate synthase|uniref:BH0559 protein n=2 Tax=Halalkalibacterium halodurans TaxID=86665 RepID=Q9KFC5_HALH5|nr:YdiK family protein [Halalkalibacterium halodurans]MDY7221055.1 YdiK family protein [Halalkalibacterium halodurans]MDY7240294.1 YdiK family protein [Halalkalibacterium halodurans]MED3645441.1 YdiK family protein [Halalkalibacterium halodurans]MED4079944.1 YdiK family protein [Halalkalibacterium halodurans]MED4086709.1 YdiK family protein [Halalkalibacterium halodurans]
MKISPTFLTLLYFTMAGLVTFFAIHVVNENGWNLWAWIMIAMAAYNVIIAIRFYQLGKQLKKRDR